MIEHSKVNFDEDTIKAVTDVLKNGWILEGTTTKEFESYMCNYVGTKYATAVTSGTLGIVLALKSLDIRKGDKVATSSYICRTVIDAIKMIGAVPFLCDINLYDYSIDYKFLEKNFHSKIKCIILPHMFGIPADINRFKNLGIPIVEDCAQSLGSKYNKKKCGSFGDISVFSFQATKMITAGEGGMLLTNSDDINEKIKYFKTSAYLNKDFAYNFNYTDIQSAIGISELGKLQNYIDRKAKIYTRYYNELIKIPYISLPVKFVEREINFFKFIIMVENSLIRDELINYAYVHGAKFKMPIAPMPIHKMLGCNSNFFPNCDDVFNRSISLPIHQYLSDENLDEILNIILDFFKSHSNK